jgi:hypothetical protein
MPPRPRWASRSRISERRATEGIFTCPAAARFCGTRHRARIGYGGAIGIAYDSAGAEHGDLGYPVGGESTDDGFTAQRFAGGTLI